MNRKNFLNVLLFTYQLASDTTVAYPAASRFDQTVKVEALDDHTVCFHFKKPYPDALFDTQMPIFEQKDFDAVISAWDADFTVNPADLWHSRAIENGYNLVSHRNARGCAFGKRAHARGSPCCGTALA